ncbi:MAG: N-acetyl-gamma-glutamyl-phosphate reductase [Candidatus Omnitrophica bacterium]|nr:N-acetyl-gamma-glutamyl-phosphate reductase [Candidatus Omnitrophota bacterium]
MKLRVGVVGATGYAGEEILRLLVRHSEVEIASLTAIIDKPSIFSDVFPAFKGIVDIMCTAPDVDDIIKKSDVVFLALPHTVSMQYAPGFLKAGKRVIDLSADYRLDPALYKTWYNHEHADLGNLKTAVYGLPELNKEKIRSARLIANPGCYPTATILAALPMVKNDLVDGEIIVDAKSGVTGAGRKAAIALCFGEVDENLKAYKINEHQHMPEMASILSVAGGKNVSVVFTPHLIPMRRGILSTVYIHLKTALPEQEIIGLYNAAYKQAAFVRVHKPGAYPEIKDVLNTNFCDIGIKVSGKLLIVVSCIDNLLKGAAGQAVQNMNIMYGFDETKGLR